MKITSIMQDTFLPLMKEAASESGTNLIIYSNRQLETSPELCTNALQDIQTADLILLYRTNYQFWDTIEDHIRTLRNTKPIICIGTDASHCGGLSSVRPEIVTTCYKYFLRDEKENISRLFTTFLQNLATAPTLYFLPLKHPGRESSTLNPKPASLTASNSTLPGTTQTPG